MRTKNKELLEDNIIKFNNDPFSHQQKIIGLKTIKSTTKKWRSLISKINMIKIA